MARRDRFEHFDSSVFINCPFDSEFQPLFWALVFAVSACGFRPRCALEVQDGGETRIGKIFRIIEESRLAIHDLSRTELNAAGLPRFNMPLELGFFLGGKRFGTGRQRRKNCLIFERTPFQYQAFISDIAGQDIRPHGNDRDVVLSTVRDWLSQFRRDLPGGRAIREHFNKFQTDLPALCAGIPIDVDELTFLDFSNIASQWLAKNPFTRPDAP